MKLLETKLSLFFLLAICCQNSAQNFFANNYAISKPESIVGLSAKEIDLFTPGVKANYNVTWNRLFVGAISVSLIAGGASLVSGNQNYDDYRNLKNEIIYQTNSFTSQDLAAYEQERQNLFEKANRQRRWGSRLLILGGSLISINLMINMPKPLRGFRLIPRARE